MASSLLCAESGITIEGLNKALDKAGKALVNMGAYDGQTLAGAISTSTHGTSINPYAAAGIHSCIKVIRKEVKGPAKGSRGIANWISGILASCPVADWAAVHLLNWFPTTCPTIINRALKILADNDYIAKSYVVMNVGAVDTVKAMALELSFDATGAATDASKLISKVNNLLSNAATNQKWYLAGPIALRFLAESDEYLAPQAARTTCKAELDLLVGINNGEKLLAEVKNAVCVMGSGVRVYCRLDIDNVTGDEVHDMFAQDDRWLSAYRQSNTSGMFNSVFTHRLGTSVPKA